MLLSLAEAKDAIGGKFIAPPIHDKTSIRSVAIDSRKVERDSLFFAFPGEKTDGHAHVSEAFRRGAAACVVTRPVEDQPSGSLIQVDNAEKALMRLGAWVRRQIKVPIIAITGSSGKSTTKEITAGLLSRRFKVLSAPESYNNEIGVPLTLLSFEPSHEVVVLEMAMRGKGQIRQLCDIARPFLGLITSIGEAHVGLLGSLEAIADAKGELLESLPADGFAFLNAEDEWTPRLQKKSKAPVRTYGFGPGNWMKGEDVKESWKGTAFRLTAPSGKIEIVFPLLGKHNLLNFLGAAAIASTLGVSLEEIKKGAFRVKSLHGRLELRRAKSGALILDDSYNANPGSVHAALETLKALPAKGRRIFAMGDMLELGKFGEKAHAAVGEEVVSFGVNAFFGLGELTEFAVKEAREKGAKPAKHFPSHEALLSELRNFVKPGDVILVKGSRKMGMEKIAEGLGG